MRKHAMLLAISLLTLACGAPAGAPAECPDEAGSAPSRPLAPTATAGAPTECPDEFALAPAGPLAPPRATLPPASAPPRAGLPGFDLVRLGQPRPELVYTADEYFDDSVVRRSCTAHFTRFEGFPLLDVDVFDIGGEVYRLHAYVDTRAPGSRDALLTRLAALYGADAPGTPWAGREIVRFRAASHELRAIMRIDQVKLAFVPLADRDSYDEL